MTGETATHRAFRAHRDNARARGIAFQFTFAEWLAWWETDGRLANRGRGRDNFVMARKGDAGPYSPGNVYCATQAQNIADVPSAVRREARRRAEATGRLSPHLRQRGHGHPRSLAVITPAGRFGSAALAADHYRITRQAAARCAREGRNGWRYVAD